ncbi:CDP-alcohol phosphatidyltransferase family protein [Micrococcoides hystricis]|uniref:CDP-alcohol phosphatidyltransferase family protein n=1 Tax=Micrococcoides hystricis TaxID=1572761 RepID=A0ABV6P8R1_9MICC
MIRLIGAGTRDDVEYVVTDRIFTVPNIVTILRFLLVPVFVYFTVTAQYLAAFITLTVLSTTDWVDGYLARRLNQISTVGKWLDPLADRLSLMITSATLVIVGIIPMWLILAIVIPDIVLIINSWRLFRGSPELEVTNAGKIRTAALLVGTPLLLLTRVPEVPDQPWTTIAVLIVLLGAIGHVLVSIHYLILAYRKAARLRAAGLDPRQRSTWSNHPKHQDPDTPDSPTHNGEVQGREDRGQ